MTEVPAWLLIVAAAVGAVVSIGSLHRMTFGMLDGRARNLITEMQIAGDLPTPDQLRTIIAEQEKLERIERRIENGLLTRVAALENDTRAIVEKLDRLLGRVDPWDGFTERRE